MSDTYPDDRFETAIARRNVTWAHYQAACAELAIARDEIGFYDLRPYVRAVNSAQDAYEWAQRDLVRARALWRAERAA